MRVLLGMGWLGFRNSIICVFTAVCCLHVLMKLPCNGIPTGGEVDGILIWPLGGLVTLGPTDGPVMNDFWIAIAGPLTHIPQILVWFLVFCIGAHFDVSEFGNSFSVGQLYQPDYFFEVLGEQAVILNAILFSFNLFVPAYPLDGGRCLAAMLVQCGKMPAARAAVVTSSLALFVACLMVGYGIYDFVYANGVNAILFILMAAFIGAASYQLFTKAKNGTVHEHPLFARPCYRAADEINRNSAASASTAAAATTATMGGIPQVSSPGGLAAAEEEDKPVGDKSWLTGV